MSKSNILYVVHAGFKSQAYCPVVYETTKLDDAYKFVHKLERSDVDYDKIYIEKQPLVRNDKRNMWEY